MLQGVAAFDVVPTVSRGRRLEKSADEQTALEEQTSRPDARSRRADLMGGANGSGLDWRSRRAGGAPRNQQTSRPADGWRQGALEDSCMAGEEWGDAT